jgi:hypothetical protein
MTRLGRASALLGVFAGDCVIQMLINGQLTGFDVFAGVCVALLGVALFECVLNATSCAARIDQSANSQGH